MYCPFKQPNDRSLLWYGSGDVDSSGWVDRADYDAMAAGTRNDMSDVDGDGVPSTRSDRSILQEYLSGSREYLPGWWNRLNTRNERVAWIRRMLAIDKTDNNNYLENLWDCNEFAIQLSLNFWGYETILPGYDTGIPDKYEQRDRGRFNLPTYLAIISPKTDAVGHSLNAVMIGSDPTKLYNWLIIDPQSDSTSIRVPGRNTDVLFCGILRFENNGVVVPYALLGYHIDPNGTDSLIHMESPVNLPRPELVVQRDNTRPALRIIYPNSMVYPDQVSELRYALKDDSPWRIFYSLDGGGTRIGPIWDAQLSDLQSVMGANTWILYARDVFGNESSAAVRFRVVPDSTRP
jgi:hypothetical protein